MRRCTHSRGDTPNDTQASDPRSAARRLSARPRRRLQEEAGPGEEAAAAAKAAPKTPAPKAPAAAAAPKGPTAEAFLAKLVPAGCKALAECKNDKVRSIIDSTGMMVAGFGSRGHKALEKKMETLHRSMRRHHHALPTESECETLANVAFQVSGLTAKDLAPKLGKTVKYDPAKASACLSMLAKPYGPCQTKFTLRKAPSTRLVKKFGKAMGKALDDHTSICNQALTGMVPVGKPCTFDYECAGESSTCRSPGHHRPKVCVAPSKHKAVASHRGHGRHGHRWRRHHRRHHHA